MDSVEAEGSRLGQRMADDELGRDRVALAAYLQYPPAAAALEQELQIPVDLAAWAAGLVRWEPEAAIRVAAAAARAVAPWWWPEERPLAPMLEGLEAWIDCPCNEHAGAFLSVEWPARIASMSGQVLHTVAEILGCIESHVGQRDWEGVGTHSRELTLECLGDCVQFASWVLASPKEPDRETESEDLLPEDGDPQAALAAIRADVLPWILGDGDPVVDRVRAWGEQTDRG